MSFFITSGPGKHDVQPASLTTDDDFFITSGPAVNDVQPASLTMDCCHD